MNTKINDSTLYNLLTLDRFRRLVEDSRAGVYTADDKGNLTYVNSAFVNILGYVKKGDLLGKNLAMELYVDPNDRKVFLNDMERLGFVRDYEVRNRRRDGTTVVLSVTSNWIKDNANNVIGIEGIVHDITEKRKIEDDFTQEMEELKQILNFEEGLSLIHNVIRLSDFAVEQIAGILNASKCSLMLYDQETQELFIQAAKGLDKSLISSVRKEMGEPIAGIIAQMKVPVLVKNIDYEKNFQSEHPRSYATRSFMSVPIVFGPRLLGIINVADSVSQKPFTGVDLKMLCAMARAVAIALENAELFERLEHLAEGEPWKSLRHRY